MSDQPSALLSAGRVRRNSAGDEAAVQGREAGGASHLYPDYPPDYPASRDESQEQFMETCNLAPTVRAPFSTQSGAVKEAVLGAESDSPLLLPLPPVIQ